VKPQPEFNKTGDTEFHLQGLPETDRTADLRSRTPVELLASQFVEELRRGERPSVETYAKRFPLHASIIRESFPVMALLEQARLENEARVMRRSMPKGFPFTRLGGCELLCELGRGGMGVVFQARELESRHIVAVKVLPWRISMVPEWQNRFEEEARTAARMQHRNIVPVYRFGQEHGYCFYTMQFVNGVSLDHIIARLQDTDGVVYGDEITHIQRERLPELASKEPSRRTHNKTDDPPPADTSRRQLTRTSWQSFTQIMMQVCEALRYAHNQKVLHNDIKPGNVLLDSNGRVSITDFGLSCSMNTSEIGDHQSQANGTLRYMAPERLNSLHDERSDLYSLGLTLYELLTLTPGFSGETEQELMKQVESQSIRRPRHVNAAIPRGLETIVMNCTAAQVGQRYQNADQLYTDLLRFGQGQKIRSTRSSGLSGLWQQLRRHPSG
jgi:eukaryotic-like serine/threonine-protein kinase